MDGSNGPVAVPVVGRGYADWSWRRQRQHSGRKCVSVLRTCVPEGEMEREREERPVDQTDQVKDGRRVLLGQGISDMDDVDAAAAGPVCRMDWRD